MGIRTFRFNGDGRPLELFAEKQEAVLIGRDSLYVLDLRPHIIDGIIAIHPHSDGLARQRLHKYLHTVFLAFSNTKPANRRLYTNES
ncbi:hypothetical protein SUGI_0570830 [Cryptomeria japonica]|nr:hypothetical protein SUGI_0570830 [Cryptomeria japonica]